MGRCDDDPHVTTVGRRDHRVEDAEAAGRVGVVGADGDDHRVGPLVVDDDDLLLEAHPGEIAPAELDETRETAQGPRPLALAEELLDARGAVDGRDEDDAGQHLGERRGERPGQRLAGLAGQEARRGR